MKYVCCHDKISEMLLSLKQDAYSMISFFKNKVVLVNVNTFFFFFATWPVGS